MLTLVQQIQYGTPVFIIPKKEGTVRFITDYSRLNQKSVRKPYMLPRIVDTMHNMELFQYETALELDIGCYTIRLFPAIQDMTKIVNEFGEFIYNCLPMGMCASGDIFQAKVDEILGNIEAIKTYIDDIIVLSK